METNFEFRGEYYPSFYSIFFNGDFNADFSKLDMESLGTLAHEYCHYLQNIDTLVGLTSSQHFYSLINEVREHITNTKGIQLPVTDFSLSSITQSNKKKFDAFKGYGYPNKDINYDDVTIDFDNGNTILIFHKKGIEIDRVIFGNICLKEGMAHHFQLLFDSNVKHSTKPYQCIEVICKKLCPELLLQPIKLILLSYLALSSSYNGGYSFLMLLNEVRKKKNYYFDLEDREFYSVINESLVVSINGETFENTYDAKGHVIDKLEEIMDASLLSEMGYFGSIFTNIRSVYSRKQRGFADIISDDELSNTDKLTELFKVYKSPNIRTLSGDNIFPDTSPELIELVGQKLLADRVIGNKKECSYLPFCQLQSEDITGEHCYSFQWEEDIDCPFTLTHKLWGLKNQ